MGVSHDIALQILLMPELKSASTWITKLSNHTGDALIVLDEQFDCFALLYGVLGHPPVHSLRPGFCPHSKWVNSRLALTTITMALILLSRRLLNNA